MICMASEDNSWPLPYLQAAIRAWWLAEYSGFYVEDPPASMVSAVDLDEGKYCPRTAV
jgi:nuclear pore complex protein Nup205